MFRPQLHRGLAAARTALSATTPTMTAAAAPLLVSRRAAAATAASSSSKFGGGAAAGDYYNAAEEEEQDRLLEEEEFAVFDQQDGDEYLPFVHRLAKKADAMDAELRRLRWELLERRQLLMDTTPASLSGRPTRADSVRRIVAKARARQLEMERTGKMGHREQQKQKHEGGEEEAAAAQPARTTTTTTTTTTTMASSSTPTAADYAAYVNWMGSSSCLVQWPANALLRRASSSFSASSSSASLAGAGKELATLTADLDYLRRGRDMHALNYYSRMNMTPKRHIGHGLYQVIWNAWIGLQNACGAFAFNVLREVRERGAAAGAAVGVAKGAARALQFLFYGWVVSPAVHIPRGLLNSLYGPVNFFRGSLLFEPISGRWMRCTVADTKMLRHALQREKRLIRAVGRAEFRRKRMAAENKWTQRLASMGFSMDKFQQKFQGSGSSAGRKGRDDAASIPDPYQTLGVRRTASQQQIKQQYKKLAMVFHPDIVGGQSEEDRKKANEKFEAISSSYQILSNPEKRKAYDMGGARGLTMHEGKFGHFMSRTPEQMVQGIFGGEAFRRLLVGDLLRSHWSLRYEAQVSVSLHEFEGLQSIRVRQMALELADIVDVHARRPPSGPYYGHRNASNNGTAGAGARTRAVHSSSLPDPLGANSARFTATAGHRGRGRGGGGGGGGVDREMKENIMEELGDKSARANRARRTRPTTPTGGSAAAGDSPFVLVPGSNEHNCFTKDFESRCDAFVDRLSGACFGPELLSEVGQAYTTSAQRFLGLRPFYAPKQLMTRKVISGVGRVWEAFAEKTGKMEKDELARRVMSEYFNMEYDNVVADLHVALRYATQTVLQDCVESEEVRRRRCYAVWFLGERMMAKGTQWNNGKRDDADLMAYVQQAANSSANTSKPPSF